MQLVGVLILIIIAIFFIVILMTFLFHLLFIVPIATTQRLAPSTPLLTMR